MKTLRNLFLVLALTTSVAIADDGHTGTGGRCDTCQCTENCFTEGGQDGSASAVTVSEGQPEEYTTVEFWSEIFFDLIGYGQF